jgi:hypothetical protein
MRLEPVATVHLQASFNSDHAQAPGVGRVNPTRRPRCRVRLRLPPNYAFKRASGAFLADSGRRHSRGALRQWQGRAGAGAAA